MLWLWILVGLVVLLLLLCLIRVGIRVERHGNGVALDAKIGFLRFPILPRKKEREKSVSDKKKSAQTSFPKPALADIKDAVHTLAPPLKRALSRTRRGVHIYPLRLSLTLGGQDDPASAAQRYGTLQAGLWTLMPEAERLLDIPDPHIHIGVDFDAAETTVEAEAGISIRIGTLLAVVFGIGFPALRWFLRYQKKQQQTAKTPEAVRT